MIQREQIDGLQKKVNIHSIGGGSVCRNNLCLPAAAKSASILSSASKR